jgi:hypothetical protein
MDVANADIAGANICPCRQSCHSRAATWHIKRTQLVQHAGKLHGFDALLSEV